MRFAYSNRTDRSVVASALLITEITGVMPLPPLNAISGVERGRRVNTPAGRVSTSTSPSATSSSIQLETCPPGTRFTVVVSSASVCGELDIE